MIPRLHRGHFFGECARATHVAGLTMTETMYSPKLMLSAHSHEAPYCCLVVRGSYDETIRGHTRTLGPNALVFHPEGEVHADRFGGYGGRCFNVEFGVRFWERLRSLNRPVEPARAAGSAVAWLAFRMYSEFRQPDGLSALASEGLALALLAEIARMGERSSRRVPPPWFAAALNFIRERYRLTFTLDDVAAAGGVHPVHLARTFRRYQGCTIGGYVRQLRIEWARREIATADTPLSALALDAGFADQSHFARVFRRVTGISPSEYRRLVRAR